MSFEAQEAFGGILSIVAVGFVTWMVFWMRRAAHTLKGDLHGKMHEAQRLGAVGVFIAALLAVGREGLETALFLYPTFQAQGAGSGPAIGALLGILTAVVIGLLIYRGTVQLNLSAFFKVTGAALIVIAAGVLAYGVHNLQEAGILPGLNNLAWDIEGYDVTSVVRHTREGDLQPGPADVPARGLRLPGLPDPHDVLVPAPGRSAARGAAGGDAHHHHHHRSRATAPGGTDL